jgi:hypothetical protein
MKRLRTVLAAAAVAAVAAPAASADHDPSGGDRHYWLCYAAGQVDPGVYPREVAEALFAHGTGYTVPLAVREPVSRTQIGHVYLTCTLPAGYTVVEGAAVSTGRGEIHTDDTVAARLEMRLDYTRLAALRP